MRKLGVANKNPNPPWPNEQSLIVLPPGSNATAVGLSEQESKKTISLPVIANKINNLENKNHRENRTEPIMGNMNMRKTNNIFNNPKTTSVGMSVGNFLCDNLGKYVKLEFLFGENTHMEKTGQLKNVGKDFVAILENGTNTLVVCALNKIKFINIYE